MSFVLLIEDDPLLVDIYLTKLKESGFEVDFANDGEKAIEKIREKVPDIILLDLLLPKIDGWGILEKIKEMKRKEPQKFENLKIMILSNLGQKEDVEKALMLGADKYLIKSQFTPTEVVEEIRKLIL